MYEGYAEAVAELAEDIKKRSDELIAKLGDEVARITREVFPEIPEDELGEVTALGVFLVLTALANKE